MSGPPEPSTPHMRVAAQLLLEIELSGQVSLTTLSQGLHLSGPFGILVVPYERMKSVTMDTTGGIRVDADGARLWLDASRFPHRMALFRLLQDKIGVGRGSA